MALKHLKNALDLLNAGMSIADITAIVKMKDEPEQETQEQTEPEHENEETQNEDEPEQETQEQTEPEQKEPEKKPEKKNPYQEKSTNSSSPENLVDELNKLF